MVRIDDNTYSWVEAASSNTDLGGGWESDNLGHFWNPHTQGWQDTGPYDPGVGGFTVDLSSPEPDSSFRPDWGQMDTPQATNTDLGGGWFDDNLGHFWNPATQGWQDTYGSPDYGGLQGPVDPYSEDMWARTPWAAPDWGNVQGPVDYTSDNPDAWNPNPNPANNPYSLSLDSPSPFDFSGGWQSEPAFQPFEENPMDNQYASNWFEAFNGDPLPPSSNRGFMGDLRNGLGNAGASFLGGGDFAKDWQKTVPDWLPYDEQIGEIGAAMFNPSTVVTAFAGPAIGGGIRGAVAGKPLALNLAGRAAANLVEPAANAGPWKNLLIEGAMNAGGQFFGEKSGEIAAEYTDNPWVLGAASVGGALAGALATGQFAKGRLRGFGVDDVGYTPHPRPDDTFVPPDFRANNVPPMNPAPLLPLAPNEPIGVFDETATGYIGRMIRMPAALGPNAEAKNIIKIAQDGTRATNGAAITLDAMGEPHWRQLDTFEVDGRVYNTRGSADPRIYVGDDGNTYIRGIDPSPTDVRLGLEAAPLQSVRERPSEYNLTPKDRQAIEALSEIAEKSATEREIFGIPINRLAIDDEDRYGPRKVIETAQGKLDKFRPGGGNRLSAPKDKPRLWDHPSEAIAAGVVYADPRIAQSEYIARNLDKALQHHVKTLLDPLGESPRDRVDDGMRAIRERLNTAPGRIDKRLQTAERRAGIAEKQGQELQKPLARLNRVNNAEEARAVLADARKNLRDAQGDATEWARAKGGATVAAQNAQRTLDNLTSRAATIDAALAKLETQYPEPRISIRVDRAGRVWTDTENYVRQAAAIQEKMDVLVARLLKLPGEEATTRAAETSILNDIASIRLTGAKAGVRQSEKAAIAAAKEIIPEDVTTAFRQMQRRLDVLEKRGGKWAEVARQLKAEAAAARDANDDFTPKWNAHVASKTTPPPGRRAVDLKLAPHLQGIDYENQTAARLEAYYGRGIRIGDRVVGTNIPGARPINAFVTPMNSVLDFSVTVSQLGMSGVRHPGTFAKNFVLAARDMFDDVSYKRWEAENIGDAAAHGVAIQGGAAKATDFEFGSWLERVPGLSQTQKHFQRFGNRQRVDLYNQATNIPTKGGVVMTDAEKFEFGRGLNRLTGVSNTRATDAEQLVEFAPNFLRAHVETLIYAFSKGGIEGKMAREYLGTWAAVGMATSVGIAMAQGRDWREVAKPFIVDGEESWTPDGRNIRINPNFATIRAKGLDSSVFGSYDSLARLMIISADAANHAIREKDALQLFDAVGYFGQTKGSPGVKFLTDLIKQETFMGENPTSLGTTLKRFMPFTAQNTIDAVQTGRSLTDVAWETGIGAFGVKTNPTTVRENLDALSPGGDFYALPKTEAEARAKGLDPTKTQERILYENPDLRARRESQRVKTSDRADRILEEPTVARAVDNKSFRVLDSIDLDKDTALGKAATTYSEEVSFAVNDKEAAEAGRALKDRVSRIQADAAMQKEGQLRGNPDLFAARQKDPLARAVGEYYATFRQASEKTGTLDYDEHQMILRQKELGWTEAQRKAVYDEINKTRTHEDPVINQLFKDQKTLRDSGYWDADGMEGRLNKTQFRKENPTVAAIVHKYGYSPVSVGIEDITTEFRAKQVALDAELSDNAVTPKEWREERGDLVLSKRERIEGLLAAFPAMKPYDLKPGSPTDNYFKQIDAAKDTGGKVNWDKVDAWLAVQSQADQDVIDHSLDLNKTPKEREYRADSKDLAESGYWDIHDAYWQRYVTKNSVPAEYSEEEYWDALRGAYVERALSKGWSEAQAAQAGLADWNTAYAKFQSPISDYQERWRKANPYYGDLLAKWQYAGYGKDETNARIRRQLLAAQ